MILKLTQMGVFAPQYWGVWGGTPPDPGSQNHQSKFKTTDG
jgi:hypothetical protein